MSSGSPVAVTVFFSYGRGTPDRRSGTLSLNFFSSCSSLDLTSNSLFPQVAKPSQELYPQHRATKSADPCTWHRSGSGGPLQGPAAQTMFPPCPLSAPGQGEAEKRGAGWGWSSQPCPVTGEARWAGKCPSALLGFLPPFYRWRD